MPLIYHCISLLSFTKYLLNAYNRWGTALSAVIMLTNVDQGQHCPYSLWAYNQGELRIKSAIQTFYVAITTVPPSTGFSALCSQICTCPICWPFIQAKLPGTFSLTNPMKIYQSSSCLSSSQHSLYSVLIKIYCTSNFCGLPTLLICPETLSTDSPSCFSLNAGVLWGFVLGSLPLALCVCVFPEWLCPQQVSHTFYYKQLKFISLSQTLSLSSRFIY